MNNKAISVSLFGNKIHYFLKSLWNIKSFLKHNLFSEFDYVLNTDEESKKLLFDIAKQENIIIPDTVIVISDYNKNTYFSGSMWRFHPIYKCNYDYLYIADIDDFLTDLYLYLYRDFTKANKRFGMWKVGNTETKSLGDAGRMFVNKTLLTATELSQYEKILCEIDKIENFSYGHDNVFVNNFLKNEFKNNVKYYISNSNIKTFLYIKENCNNIVDIRNLEQTLKKDVTIDRQHFLEEFKFYNKKLNTYYINDNSYIVDRTYTGLTCENNKLMCNAYSKVINILKEKSV